MRDVNGGMKILGLESLVLNRILYIAPWREEACKYPDQATLSSGVPQEKGASRSRFSVIITCDPENSGLYPNQPPQMRNPAIEVSRPQSIRRQPPTYSTHRNSLNSTIRFLAIPPDEHDDCWWVPEEKARPGGGYDCTQQTNLISERRHTAQAYKRHKWPCTIKARHQRLPQIYRP